MALHYGYGGIPTDSLVLHVDTEDTLNCYGGAPTTNLLSDTALGNYNNVGGSVRTDLRKTEYKFRDAYIWEQVITPLDASGVNWLTGGNNPGIGVVTGGGGGTGGRYTGHSIFFKPTVPMTSAPVYTHYSNIGGWQSSTNYEYIGDGWYRAVVVWYDSVTRSDGKYWAINPTSAQLNVPMYFYWAGPFKEDLNLNLVSPYTQTSRTVAVRDLSPTNAGITTTNSPYDYYGDLNFDGSDDYLQIDRDVLPSSSPYTLFTVLRPSNISSPNDSFPWYNSYPSGFWHHISSGGIAWRHSGGSGNLGGLNIQNNVYTTIAVTWDGHILKLFQNGSEVSSVSTTAEYSNNGAARIGMLSNRSSANDYNYNGKAPVNLVYSRALFNNEILNLHNHYKSRYNI